MSGYIRKQNSWRNRGHVLASHALSVLARDSDKEKITQFPWRDGSFGKQVGVV